MEQSLYSELIQQYLRGLVLQFEEEAQAKGYLHDRFLDKDYSVTGDFSSISVDNATPMAYVVDMDSPLPLIKQDRSQIVTGEIPKVGVEIQFTEKQLTEIHTLNRLGGNEAALVKKLFAPLRRVYLSQKERLEFMFKQAVSTGITVANPTNNTGANVAIDFGFKAENKYNASVVWTDTATATPVSDIARVVADANDRDGKDIKVAMMNQATFNLLANSKEAKGLVFVGMDTTNLIGVSLDQLNNVLEARFGFRIEIVKGKSILNRNGQDVVLDGWKDGTIAFLTDDKIGSLVWSHLAEDLDRKGGVDYATAEEFILLRKYKVVHPAYGEFDSAQSRSLPVVKNDIYLLDTLAVG